MSQADPAPAGPRQTSSPATPDEQLNQIYQAFRKVVEGITPWLLEFGSWTFGGLIAVTLLVMASLFTVGPVDPAIIVGTTAFALALPLEVAGVLLLRLDQDLQRIGFEEEWVQAFQDVGFTSPEIASPQDLEALRKKRTGVVLRYCLAMLTLSAILTLIGLVATLWHMAWWIGVAFLVMVVISQGIVIGVLLALQPPNARERSERRRRNREAMTRQPEDPSKGSEGSG